MIFQSFGHDKVPEPLSPSWYGRLIDRAIGSVKAMSDKPGKVRKVVAKITRFRAEAFSLGQIHMLIVAEINHPV